MMMKTRMFIAKSFAKKHYKGAMDAIKTFKADRAGGKMFTKIKTKGKKIPDFVKSNLKALKKPTGMKTKAMAAGSKIKTFASKNKTALKVAGGSAVAGGAAGAYIGSKKTRNKMSTQAGQGVGSGYLLGKQSKVKGKFQLDIAPRFRAVAESKSKINKITTHKSDKEFLKAIKTKNFKGAVINRKKPKQ